MKGTLDTIIKISKMVFILNILILVILFLSSKLSIEIFYGLMFGSIFSILNLRLLSLSLEKAVKMDPGKAQIYVSTRYFIRMILTGLVILISLRAPYINALGTIIGLFLPKCSIVLGNLFGIDKIFKGKEA